MTFRPAGLPIFNQHSFSYELVTYIISLYISNYYTLHTTFYKKKELTGNQTNFK